MVGTRRWRSWIVETRRRRSARVGAGLMFGLRCHAMVARVGLVSVIAIALAALSASPALAGWNPTVTLSRGGANTGFPTVASNGHGAVVAAWYRFQGNAAQVVARTSTNSGRNWGPRQLLGRAVLAQGGARPALLRAAVGTDGSAVVVWQQVAGKGHHVVASRASAGGKFGRVRVLSGSGVISGYPDVAFDGSGRSVAVWVTLNLVQRPLLLPGGAVSAPRVVATG